MKQAYASKKCFCSETKERLREVLEEVSDSFMSRKAVLGRFFLLEHEVELDPNTIPLWVKKKIRIKAQKVYPGKASLASLIRDITMKNLKKVKDAAYRSGRTSQTEE